MTSVDKANVLETSRLWRQTVDAVVFPLDGIRQAPSSPVDGKPMRRASTAEVEALLY